MPSAFEVLAKDHEEVKLMLAELERGRPAAAVGAGSDQLALRKKMVQLVIEESKHEAVEEMYFWAAVRDALTDGDALADQAQAQEQETKGVLHRPDKLAPEDGEFEALLAQFTEAGRQHIAFEETAVWPRLREVLSAEQVDDLGRKLGQGKRTAPTHPHPHTPPSSGAGEDRGSRGRGRGPASRRRHWPR